MEEVDNIIIHTLRQIGCDMSEDVSSLKEFTTAMIVAATSKCLHMIKEDLQIPSVLPASMSSKFRLGTALANACQEVGYGGEIGYQTFLYSNEADIRKLFMFLVEHLPKESSESAGEPLGSSVMLQRRISAELSKRLKRPWTPSFCKKDSISWSGTKPQVWHKEVQSRAVNKFESRWQVKKSRENILVMLYYSPAIPLPNEDLYIVDTFNRIFGARSVRRFHACPLRVPEGLGDLTKKIPKDLKAYYSNSMPLITSQPSCRQDVAPSVLEANAISVTLDNEWENEWNQSGLASRLSKEEYLAQKRERLEKKIKQHVKSELQRANQKAAANGDLSEIVSSLSDKASGTSAPSKGSRFTHTEQLQFAQDEQKAAAMAGLTEEGPPKVDTEEEMRKKREEELEALQSKLGELNAGIERDELGIKKSLAGIQQANEQVAGQKTKNTDQEEVYKVNKRTMDLLPDAENNIAKLQSVVDSSAQRLVNLAQQWEKHRAPLIDQYRELKQLNANRVSEAQKELEEIRSLREKMKEVADEARGKEELHKELIAEYETLGKDVNRSAYTRRILEIVGNIKKQKEEINKILIDTKDLQKEINQLSGKLERTFAVTDELIFRNCKELIQSVEETGSIVREIRDLEDQIEMKSQKNTATNLERITADYKQMKEENNALAKKLKAAK
ncbi:Coiled-coil domain-containing protein 22-like [Stylophora pistillata]|uniref:Coiled-coil domain-containing protein 22-like n=1 Tax=Stylophora pistillata TaxID=50429 RepID=A0A2B4RVC8_STYPI|nr:Coiled-coil domain-containing protein 22-like [Stylophora pistillata]